jgi:hypothetical protein
LLRVEPETSKSVEAERSWKGGGGVASFISLREEKQRESSSECDNARGQHARLLFGNKIDIYRCDDDDDVMREMEL